MVNLWVQLAPSLIRDTNIHDVLVFRIYRGRGSFVPNSNESYMQLMESINLEHVIHTYTKNPKHCKSVVDLSKYQVNLMLRIILLFDRQI